MTLDVFEKIYKQTAHIAKHRLSIRLAGLLVTFIVDASRLCDYFSVRVCVFNGHFFLAHGAGALVVDADVGGGTLGIGGTRLALLACNNSRIIIVVCTQVK